MTNERILEIARRYDSNCNMYSDSYSFSKEDLIAFARSVIEADREKPNDHESSTNQAPMHYYKFNEDGAPIRSDFHFSDGQRITDAGKEKAHGIGETE